MNLKKLKLINFWSHKDTEIDFTEDSYMIIGKIAGGSKSNGSGKSSLARSIAFSIYGDQSSEIKNDSAIYNDAKEMETSVVFELNNKNYEITRKVKRGSTPSIYIRINDGETNKYGVKDGQKVINEILGADFTIFKNTSYFKQGDLNSFSNLSPKEAKEVVMRILQLDNYNSYEELSKDMLGKVKLSINKLEADINNLVVQIKGLEEENDRDIPSDDTLKELKDDMAALQTKKRMQDIAIEERNEKVNSLKREHSKINSNRLKVAYKLEELKSRIDKLQSLNQVKTCPTCEHTLDMKKVTDILSELNDDKSLADNEHNEFLKDLQNLEEKEKEILGQKVDSTNYTVEISSYSLQIGKLEAELNRVKADTDKIEQLQKELKDKNVELKNKVDLQTRYEKLQQAFGKKGIQAYIIDNIIPEIQATTNDILDGLDTHIRVNIDSQKKLKKGGKSETLDINIITEFGERPYANYSGGEKTLIDFALRIALSVILTRRSDCKIQTLILDEVFSECDAVNRKIISKAIKHIANKFDFKKILIISHHEEMQDSFDNIIQVEFDGKSSHILKENINEKVY